MAQRGCESSRRNRSEKRYLGTDRALVILNYAALSLAIAITLWGAERIALRLETLPAVRLNVLDVDASDRFREMNGVAGPLFASASTAIAFGVTLLSRTG